MCRLTGWCWVHVKINNIGLKKGTGRKRRCLGSIIKMKVWFKQVSLQKDWGLGTYMCLYRFDIQECVTWKSIDVINFGIDEISSYKQKATRLLKSTTAYPESRGYSKLK